MNRRDFIDMVFVIGIGCLIQSSYEDNILIKQIVKIPVFEIYDKPAKFINELLAKNNVVNLLEKDYEMVYSISCWNKQYRVEYDEYLVLEAISNKYKHLYDDRNYWIHLEAIDISQYWQKHNGRFERWRHKKDWGE